MHEVRNDKERKLTLHARPNPKLITFHAGSRLSFRPLQKSYPPYIIQTCTVSRLAPINTLVRPNAAIARNLYLSASSFASGRVKSPAAPAERIIRRRESLWA